MIRIGGGVGYLRGVTSKQFWFVVIFATIVGCLFLGILHYADKEMSREPSEQEKEDFWNRYAERQSEDRAIVVDEREH